MSLWISVQLFSMVKHESPELRTVDFHYLSSTAFMPSAPCTHCNPKHAVLCSKWHTFLFLFPFSAGCSRSWKVNIALSSVNMNLTLLQSVALRMRHIVLNCFICCHCCIRHVTVLCQWSADYKSRLVWILLTWLVTVLHIFGLLHFTY